MINLHFVLFLSFFSFLYFSFILSINKIKKLTHVVIPFTYKQEKQVKKNIQMWSEQPPCVQFLNYLNVSLIFYVSQKESDDIRFEFLNFVNKFSFSKCFISISVEFAELEDDSYLNGSRIMFEKMISKKINFGKQIISHIFYMEPDCIPIRGNWLEALNNQVIRPNSEFLIKGSIFRGKKNAKDFTSLYLHFHINGNAIYNLENEKLTDFYFKKVYPFFKKIPYAIAYDVLFFKALFDKDSSFTPEYYHLFQFSDFIQNYWHSRYDLSKILKENENTFFVHGGYSIKKTIY